MAATIALVLAMCGGAVAATHYLINSTGQINPRVLRKLRGNTGPRGPQGAAGPDGSQLSSGETITGSFAAAAPPGTEGGRLVASISYPATLTTNPTPEVSLYGQSMPGCPGATSAPAAERGHLCVYMGGYNDIVLSTQLKGGAGPGDFRYGAALYVPIPTSGCKTCEPEIAGTWAYTAP